MSRRLPCQGTSPPGPGAGSSREGRQPRRAALPMPTTGKPVLRGLSAADLDALVVLHAPNLRRALDEAAGDAAAGRVVSLDEAISQAAVGRPARLEGSRESGRLLALPPCPVWGSSRDRCPRACLVDGAWKAFTGRRSTVGHRLLPHPAHGRVRRDHGPARDHRPRACPGHPPRHVVATLDRCCSPRLSRSHPCAASRIGSGPLAGL